MRRITYLLILALTVFLFSCGNTENTDTKKQEENKITSKKSTSKTEKSESKKEVKKNDEVEKKKEFIPSDKCVQVESLGESPETDKGNFDNIVKMYNDIMENYTVENPEIDRMFTEVTVRKKNDEIGMIKVTESDSNYENTTQYFYKKGELFYAYISNSSSDSQDADGAKIFETQAYKYYFKKGKCVLFLSTESEGSLASDIIKDADKFMERTKNNNWKTYDF